MANKREFKKYITAVSESLNGEMMEAYYTIEGIDKDAIENAVIDVMKAGEVAIMMSNVKFDKGTNAFSNGGYRKAKREFFRTVYAKANAEFTEAVNGAIKKFNAAIPAAVKEAQKA